jgi:Cdc6-like AAA superfamily ATPase
LIQPISHIALQFKDPVSFERYSEDEMLTILRARVGSNVIAEAVLKFVCKKIASASGDVREALEMLSEAVKDAQNTVSAVRRDTSEPLVTMQNMMKHNKKVNKSLVDIIDGLPMAGKVLLCAVTTLAQDNVKLTTMGKLKAFVNQCLHKHPDELMSLEDFSLTISSLEDNGLLKIGNLKTSAQACAADMYDQQIHLTLQLEDVTNILEKELDNVFYQDIRDHSKRNRNQMDSDLK